MGQITPSTVESIVTRILGRQRVRSVQTEFRETLDGASIARIIVTYDASSSPTLEERDQVFEALWDPEEDALEAAFPVIDFQSDTDVEPVAAE